MSTIRDDMDDSTLKKLSTATAIDTKNPTVKNFIETVHKVIMQKLPELQAREESTNEKLITANRVFKMFCADIHISPNNCAQKLNEQYGYNFTDKNILDFFNYQRIKTYANRMDIFSAVHNEVKNFMKAMLSKNPEDYKALQESYLASMKKCYRDSEREKFSRRLFCMMVYTKYPELNIYNDLEKLEIFGNTQAKYVYSEMFNCLRIAFGKMDERQRENEQLKSALQLQETGMQNLSDNFDAQLQKEMIEFYRLLNSDKYGKILDSIMKVYNGVSQLRRQNLRLPLEISDIGPLLNNFRKFGKENGINPIMKINSVHSMKAADIDKLGEYEGTPFSNADEVKTVRVISPGWRYKDIQIFPPKFKEEVEIVEQNE